MKTLPDVVRHFNWIDILVIILSLRIIYISLKNGLKSEFFKVLGTLSGLYLSLHYFSALGSFLNGRIFNRDTHSAFSDTIAFILLALAGYGVFFVLRVALGRIIQSQIDARFDRWGGLVAGACRALLTVSLCLCLFLATSTAYLRKSVNSSFSGPYVSRVAPDTYTCFWNTLASKLQRNEKFNPAAKDLTKI